MNDWKKYSVGGKTVRYARGTRPRGKGIQIAFVYKGENMKLTWNVDPSQQRNAEAANEKRKIILNEILLEERGHEKFDITRHFPDYAARKAEGESTQERALLVSAMWRWMQSNQSMQLAPSTREDYAHHIAAYEACWPSLQVSDFNVSHLRDVIQKKQSNGVSLKTIRNQFGVLRATCDMLLDEDTNGFSNPFDKLRPKDLRKSHEEITAQAAQDEEFDPDPYTPTELERLLALLSGEMRNQVLLYLEGPRTGELFAAGWDDVDWDNKRIRIKRTFSRRRIGPRKNGKEVVSYWCLLSDDGMAALRDQKQYTYLLPPVETGTAFGAIRFIFVNPHDRRPWNRSQKFCSFWQRLSIRAGVRYRSPYHMRHTCASHLFSAGATPAWVAEHKLGNSEAMTRKVYAKRIAEVTKLAGIDERAVMNKVWKKS